MIADPVILFRAWRPTPAGNLVACYRRIVWPAHRDVHADCIPAPQFQVAANGTLVEEVVPVDGHSPPGPRCQCGLWGDYSLERLARRFKKAPQWGYVYGVALGFGEVSHGEQGLRAASARVLAIADDSDVPEATLTTGAARYLDLAAIAGRYGVALVPWRRLTAHAARFGDVLPPPRPEFVTGGIPDVR